ncbi:extracellular solute-binding protein [Phreatobacter sp. AB_2022a]|uniref:extracellular solute-binding protein n=1 Tax=Phreatobacter sp. AB_2022a TaxID=3003134 RepID=UPI0022870C04|nr:extracellular solute-binding protein [Phreatobacter sp. AB_2022a]MCZ0736856.1 extracellular solute-binding protein [Phreatobacter sp. AB_2022a]
MAAIARLLAAFAILFAAGPGAGPRAAAAADTPRWRHGLSLVGQLRYGPDFRHTAYVNPQAPKGGLVRLSIEGTFDSFNPILPRGATAPIAGLLYMPLFEDSLDEISTAYGAVAEAVRHPDDFSSVTYRLNPNARWHDGRPITPDDVIWTMEQVKKHDPRMAFYYRNVVKVEQSGEREVTFTFDGPGNREKPQIVGQLPILPRHWWEGRDAQGRQRDIGQTTLEPPLGSGPYRIRSFEAGRNVVLERVSDWWAKDLPIYVGLHNFDELRFEVYRDDTVELEAFKADQVDFRVESSARAWATAYDFPAARDGRVLLEAFTDRSPAGMQAVILNLRLPKFADVRVRRALNLMFDFETMNANLMFGAYRRTASYFEDTELAARGLPGPEELAILETVRDKVPPEVFTTPYANPVGGSPDAQRANLRAALALMREAGYEVRDRRMVNVRTGEPFRIELLLNSPTFERHALAYRTALERLGIELTPRTVDTAQYINRLNDRRFDAIVGTYPQTLSPGNEQRDFFGSEAADRPGSFNRAGIKDPAVDQLIQRVIYAKDRAELVAATRALDRVLLANSYMIPTWFSGQIRTARWNRYGRPQTMPEYGGAAFPAIWWWDPALAQRAGPR